MCSNSETRKDNHIATIWLALFRFDIFPVAQTHCHFCPVQQLIVFVPRLSKMTQIHGTPEEVAAHEAAMQQMRSSNALSSTTLPYRTKPSYTANSGPAISSTPATMSTASSQLGADKKKPVVFGDALDYINSVKVSDDERNHPHCATPLLTFLKEEICP